MLRNSRLWISCALVLVLCAFSRPEHGDLIELEGFLNARTDSKFRTIDHNVAYVLPRGTRAQVEQVQYFSDTGNYGLRIRILNANGIRAGGETSLWVYYNVKNPSMKLYSLKGNDAQVRQQLANWEKDPKVRAQEVSSPTRATQAVMTRDTTAIQAPRPSVAPAPAQDAVQRAQNLNALVRQAIDPAPPDCPQCRAAATQYPSCTPQNNYLETQLDRLQGRTVVGELMSTTPRYPRLEACVRESMLMSGGSFAMCPLGHHSMAGYAPRACTSERLVRVVQNSLTLSVDCLAGYLNGNDGNLDMLKETFRNTVALVNLESGFHTNAISSTGAAGLGQFTNGATAEINKATWSEMQNYLRQSSNPSCQTLKGLDLKPVTPTASAVCQRMSLENGNPLVNMLYTIGHMKTVRREVEVTMKRGLREAGVQLSPANLEKLTGALTNWGHNTGPYGIRRPLSSLLYQQAGVKALKDGNIDQFLNLLKGEVRSFHMDPSQAHGRSASAIARRANEASGFYQFLQNKMNLLERKVGRECTP